MYGASTTFRDVVKEEALGLSEDEPVEWSLYISHILDKTKWRSNLELSSDECLWRTVKVHSIYVEFAEDVVGN